MRRLERFRRLPPEERRLLVRAWGALVLATLALRVLSFPRLVAVGRALAGRASHAGPPVARLVWLVETAGRYAPGTTCLTTALVAGLLLRRQGLATTLHIGVSRADRALAAHAWLEADGRVLVGHQERDAYDSIFTGSLAA